MALPEHNHPKWNDYLRASASAGLTLATLKGTLLCNFGRGPFKSGRFGFTVARAAEQLMSSEMVDEEFLAHIAESIAYDMGQTPEAFGTLSRDDFLNVPGIRTRIKEAARHSCLSV